MAEVRSVRRALALMRLMNERENWTLQDLAERSGLAKATLHRLLHTLELEGYAYTPPTPPGSYRLTSRTRELSAGVGRVTALADIAEAFVKQGTLDLDWPISFAVPELPFMRIVACGMPYLPAHSAKPTSMERRHWLFSSAVGSAYLSVCTDDDAVHALNAAVVFCRDTSTALPIPPVEDVRRLVERARKAGFAMRIASHSDLNSALAVPVFAGGCAIGALACSTFPRSLTAKFIAAKLDPLRMLAEKLGDACGDAEMDIDTNL